MKNTKLNQRLKPVGLGRFSSGISRFLVWVFFYKITGLGIQFVMGLMICVIAATVNPSSVMINFSCGTIAVVLVAYLVALFVRPFVTVSGAFPSQAIVGHPVTGTFFVKNESRRRSAHDIGLGYYGLPWKTDHAASSQTVDSLPAKESFSFQMTLNPTQRGQYLLPPLRCFSQFPLNLFRIQTRGSRVSKETLIVLPHFHPMKEIHLDGRSRYQAEGVPLTSQLGESPEYIGNRDYVLGDPIRNIDFKSWARLVKPVVREYQEEYYCRVGILLDTYLPRPRFSFSSKRNTDSLEAAVSMTAALADAVSRGEAIIDIFAAGETVHVFQAGRHIANFESVLEALASVERCPRNPFRVLHNTINDHIERLSSLILVLTDWDPERALLARCAAECDCEVKIVIVRNGACSCDPADARQWASSVALFTPEEVWEGAACRLD